MTKKKVPSQLLKVATSAIPRKQFNVQLRENKASSLDFYQTGSEVLL
jgi:hypothetical protein